MTERSIPLPMTVWSNGTRGFTRYQLENDVPTARFYQEFKEWFRVDWIYDRVVFLEKPHNARLEEDRGAYIDEAD